MIRLEHDSPDMVVNRELRVCHQYFSNIKLLEESMPSRLDTVNGARDIVGPCIFDSCLCWIFAVSKYWALYGTMSPKILGS